MEHATQTPRRTSAVSLAVFWAYVLIPLTWGVVNTLRQAMKLFG
ncbi:MULTISPECIES: oxalate:formate antiporter [unclassified Trinickia]|nr:MULTISPECIES: oxalate:formate antiporter [unclassified Trinickia]MDG0023038.1 oxalate:formate antiporter [Trinickia sp. Y13]HVW51298.1 oxalate:formate antiporter [Trinickia sp.]